MYLCTAALCTTGHVMAHDSGSVMVASALTLVLLQDKMHHFCVSLSRRCSDVFGSSL
jgi:hypothetical protein